MYFFQGCTTISTEMYRENLILCLVKVIFLRRFGLSFEKFRKSICLVFFDKIYSLFFKDSLCANQLRLNCAFYCSLWWWL